MNEKSLMRLIIELLGLKIERFWQNLLETRGGKWMTNAWSYVGIDDYIALLFLAVGLLGQIGKPFRYVDAIDAFYRNISPELIGIGFSVLLISNAVEVISRRQEKDRLIFQMGSPTNDFAIEAIRQLRAKGWLCNGTLKKADLYEANLSRANLIGADLRGCNLCRASIVGADLNSADLSGASLDGANLSGSNLRGINLENASLSNMFKWSHSSSKFIPDIAADLSESILEFANMSGAVLKNANLTKSNLRGAILSKANLSGADLRGAKLNWPKRDDHELEDANFIDAQYTRETLWPEGFDPKAAGAILVDSDE